MAAQSLNTFYPLRSHARTKLLSFSSKSLVLGHQRGNFVVLCSTTQESPATVTDKKDTAETAAPVAKPADETAAPVEKPAAAAKPKKAPTKELPELMQEDVIPSLKSILEAQEDLSQIELSFQDNRLQGSFVKNNIPYSFWAFFPNGVLTGPKGFSLSSYGSEVSTVEPFLIDEKKITAKHVVFWVEKRLAAQGILPVWKQDEEDSTAK
ncbi:hypothetical protein FCM35_KLT07722 [Carex littledalei]|uniref:Uncharacterized protein n=1 Tax=Carex littledalei TaxID=544730 RepID=A0A833R079_9POAL|nr:hypothetical protein FCM35_KLT07722 [Carex littledalei]